MILSIVTISRSNTSLTFADLLCYITAKKGYVGQSLNVKIMKLFTVVINSEVK